MSNVKLKTTTSGFKVKTVNNIVKISVVESPIVVTARKGVSYADLALKQDLLAFTPENVANKSTSTSLGTSNTLYPSQNAVKSYVDTVASGKANSHDPFFTGQTTWDGPSGTWGAFIPSFDTAFLPNLILSHWDGSAGSLNVASSPGVYSITLTGSTGQIAATGTITGSNLSGTNTGDQLTFKTIAVSGQSNVVADTTADTLTLVAGTNITITTDASTDAITINSTASGGGTWGTITGTLSSQTDLQTALNAKANLSGDTFTGTMYYRNGSGPRMLISCDSSVVGNGPTFDIDSYMGTPYFDFQKPVVVNGTVTAPSIDIVGGFEFRYDTPTETLSIMKPTSAYAHIRMRDLSVTESLSSLVSVLTPELYNTTQVDIVAYTDLGEDTTINLTATDVNVSENLTTASLNISGQTASAIAGFDASKNVTSLSTATYPSLTELSYVKGVTSAIQTQLGDKAPLASPTFTGTVTTPILSVSSYATIGGATHTSGYLDMPGLTTNSSLKIGALEFQGYGLNNNWFGDNVYYDGSNFKRRATGSAGLFYFQGTEGQFRFYGSGSGSLGNGIGNTVQFKVTSSGIVAFGGYGSSTASQLTGFSTIANSTGISIGLGSVPFYPLHVSGTADTLVRVKGTGSSTGAWKGRIIAGGDTVAFLMGERNSQAWLGAHNAALSAWSDFYLNPDGGNKLYLGSQDSGGEGVQPVLTVTNASGDSARVGIGNITSPSAKLHTVATTEQLRLGYDTSNYLSTTVGSSGGVTFDAVGTGAGFTFSDSLNITSSLQCDSIVNDTGLAHGTYTPTITIVSNVDLTTAHSCHYTRVGNQVTVFGSVVIDQTAAGAYEIGISLPIASNFSSVRDLTGHAASINATGVSDEPYLEADTTNDRASFKGNDTDISAHSHYFHFMYTVI